VTGALAKLTPLVEDGGTVVAFVATGQAPVLPLPDLIYRGISLRSFFILNSATTTSSIPLVKTSKRLGVRGRHQGLPRAPGSHADRPP
jgi:hypothetical protein